MSKVKSINQYRLTPGFGGFTPVSYETTECRLPCRKAASVTCDFVYIICYMSSLCYCCKAYDIRRLYEIRCSAQSQSKRITADTH
ncbi:hypothetical protein CI674_026130 [Escherichia coli]|nr:hypothetical protein CI674_026130 [Escherichia coli]